MVKSPFFTKGHFSQNDLKYAEPQGLRDVGSTLMDMFINKSEWHDIAKRV